MSEQLKPDGWEPDVSPTRKIIKGRAFIYLDTAQAAVDAERQRAEKAEHPIVRCSCCGGTQIWKRNDAGEICVIHACTSKYGNAQALMPRLEKAEAERDEARAECERLQAQNARLREVLEDTLEKWKLFAEDEDERLYIRRGQAALAPKPAEDPLPQPDSQDGSIRQEEH